MPTAASSPAARSVRRFPRRVTSHPVPSLPAAIAPKKTATPEPPTIPPSPKASRR